MPVRPAALLVLLLGLAVLATGCTGSSEAPVTDPADGAVVLPKYYDPRRLLADVGTRMHTDGGARVSLAGTLTGPSGAVPVTGGGAVLFDRARAGAGARSAGAGPGAAPGAAPSVRLELRTGDPARAPTALVRTAGRTWVRPPGAGWLETGRDPVPPAAATEAMIATNVAGGLDPLADVARYADAALVADAVDERVDGVPTVHYTLVVDLVRAIATETDPARRAVLVAQRRAGTTRLSGEVWLDADRRPVQGRIRRQLPGAGALEVLIRYRAWGSAVRVDPPVPG